MSSPEEQRRKLERDLRQHEHRADRINEEIRNLNNELRIHNVILSLGRDKKLLNLLDQLRDDEVLARKSREIGRSFFEQQGVELPPEIQVVTGAPTGQGARIRGVFLDDAGREYEVVWDSQRGFDVHPEVRAKNPLDLTLSHAKERTQQSTDFTLTGTGFTPNGQVSMNIFMEPGLNVPNRDIGSVSANHLGEISRFHRAWYLHGPDPQTRNPAFIARDVTEDQAAIDEVSSASWYPLL
ncbi:hypothetical protein PUR61_09535 [Streptomyces sp. BE20]|uniref:hypothetical protein n=1 Tax=Streptomyces sp. BE20 TaxID=3002525 RepID=UPI002E79942F|nr:hypothetical protein [Streptomyces sp. BE20]MEE1822431.1 hypothetical protein [Streptomyces sp. BE20]